MKKENTSKAKLHNEHTSQRGTAQRSKEKKS